MIFQLNKSLHFPNPSLADPDGLLAIGGDLSPERILLAYKQGVFPWFNAGEPILWWSPNPRMVLYPTHLKVSKSMRQVLKNKQFSVSLDTQFEQVIKHCANSKRLGQSGGTWINKAMLRAYCDLFNLGYAHSVEVYNSAGNLVGGLYGLALGKCFFGESMFTLESNASKTGFISLVQYLQNRNYQLIDCQVASEHLSSLGAQLIDRPIFLEQIAQATGFTTDMGKWQYNEVNKI